MRLSINFDEGIFNKIALKLNPFLESDCKKRRRIELINHETTEGERERVERR